MTLFDYLVLEGAAVEKRSNGAILTLNDETFAFSDDTNGLWVGEMYYYANSFNRQINEDDVQALKEFCTAKTQYHKTSKMEITFSTDFIQLIGWEKYQALMSGKASLSIGANEILMFTDNMSVIEKIANGKIEKL